MGVEREVELVNTVIRLSGGSEGWVTDGEWAEAGEGSVKEVLEKVMKRRSERGVGCKGVMRALLAVEDGGAVDGKQAKGDVTIEKLDDMFKRIASYDTFTESVCDGIVKDQNLVNHGVTQMEYTRKCEVGISSVFRTVAELESSVEKMPSTPPAVVDVWARSVPVEIVPIFLGWVMQLARTTMLLSRVVQQLFTRDSSRMTEHEAQLADPHGLVVSTVFTPSTLSTTCSVFTRSWLGKPVWTPSFVVLWQQLLYIFPTSHPNDTCQQCHLLRGCRINTISSHHGRSNVICLTDFLANSSTARHSSQVLLSFDVKDCKTWTYALRTAMASPPIREVDLTLRAVRKQAQFELDQKLQNEKIVND